ncbi:MAG: hypothetical protein WD342_17060 [Verrucomicrobiales bacterium]
MTSTGLTRAWGWFLAAAASSSMAHDSLYNYIEIRMEPDGSAKVEFTVHAAELAAEYGVDPTSDNLDWLDSLTDEEVRRLIRKAGEFVGTSYRVEAWSGKEVEFPTIPEIRAATVDAPSPRPGCFVGILHSKEAPVSLDLAYADSAGKRLMIVVTRPGVFPQVRDLAPGDTIDLALSPADSRP